MILLTGGTGFLGRELLVRLLAESAANRVAVLVRPSRSGESAHERVRLLLADSMGADTARYLDQIRVVEGDVSLENFGLGATEFCALAAETTGVIHAAASTSFTQTLYDARAINVSGTYEVLKFSELAAQRNPNFRLFHISTAYVAGDTENTVQPESLSLTSKFRNAYERSKAEAELLVQQAVGRVPSCILRPSMIIGDSNTGATSAFNVIYAPARLLATGVCSVLPARANTPVDLVPINYVAEAVLAFQRVATSPGSTYHLCAGVGRESTLREIIDFLIDAFNVYARKGIKLLEAPAIVPPEMIQLAYSSLNVATTKIKQIEVKVLERIDSLKHLLPFAPYMASNPRFDISQTTKILQGLVGEPPLFKDYAEKVFNFCFETNWGKRKLIVPAIGTPF